MVAAVDALGGAGGVVLLVLLASRARTSTIAGASLDAVGGAVGTAGVQAAASARRRDRWESMDSIRITYVNHNRAMGDEIPSSSVAACAAYSGTHGAVVGEPPT